MIHFSNNIKNVIFERRLTKTGFINMRKLFIGILFTILGQLGFAQPFDWALRGSGNGYEYGYDVETDDFGNIYVYGRAGGNMSFSPLNLTAGNGDAYVVKYNSARVPQWAIRISTSGSLVPGRIDLDADGNAYVCGGVLSGNVTCGAFTAASAGMHDAYVIKISATGVSQWVKTYGSSNNDIAYDIAIGSAGNVWVGGVFSTSTTLGSFNLTSAGNNDAFVFVTDTLGNVINAASYGGAFNEFVYNLTVDGTGACYISGTYGGAFTFGSFPLSYAGSNDMFVAKLSASLSPEWAIALGGTNLEGANAITTDAFNNVYVAGSFMGTSYFGSYELISAGNTDSFVAKIDNSGNVLWAKRSGGSSSEEAKGVVVSATGDVFVAGYFLGSSTFDTKNISATGASDMYVAVYDTDGNVLDVQRGGGGGNDQTLGMCLSGANSVIVTGYYESSMAGFSPHSLMLQSGSEMFIVGYSKPCEPALIITEPVSTSGNVGDNVSFTVVASGSAPITYTWTGNSETIGGNSDVLELTNITPDDAGNYFVTVTNACGTDISQTVTLSVNSMPAPLPTLLKIKRL